MDIAALSIAINQSSVREQANLSVMKMAMDSSEQTAVNMAKMLESAAQPHLGSTIDLKG
ncbi:YjfB family protein [Fictibacillus iocasae]|uniref:YjfB family protein n=1 Tax=Fictibacillus iocasae TaxID=2715437 RepID=A0ABW2NT20_9BACL